jgi:hypothetical protein
MASARQLNDEITTSRQKLRDALQGALSQWETGDDEGWSPRRIAEHCIDRDFGLAGIAAAALRGTPPAERYARTGDPDAACQCSFPTAAEALTALVESAEAGDEVFGVVVDEDLVKPAELHAGSLPNSVEGVMMLAAWHLNDHAEQIPKAMPALR